MNPPPFPVRAAGQHLPSLGLCGGLRSIPLLRRDANIVAVERIPPHITRLAGPIGVAVAILQHDAFVVVLESVAPDIMTRSSDWRDRLRRLRAGRRRRRDREPDRAQHRAGGEQHRRRRPGRSRRPSTEGNEHAALCFARCRFLGGCRDVLSATCVPVCGRFWTLEGNDDAPRLRARSRALLVCLR